MKYKLANDVFYRLYGENVLLYQTAAGMVYVFSETAKTLLDFFKDETDEDEVIAKIAGTYLVTEGDKGALKAFIADLKDKKILIPEYKLTREIMNVETKFREEMLPKGQLYSAMFELTYRCNEKCRYCYCTVDDTNELTTDEIKKALDELYDMNVFNVTFTGGDLFVRKDTFEILEYAYSKNFLIDIFTNGIALTDNDMFRLRKINPRSIHFTLYHYLAEKHDWFTQVPGSFNRTVSAIKKCLAMNIPVTVKHTVTTCSLDAIEGLMQFVKELGAAIQIGISVSAKNDGDKEPVQFRLTTKEEYMQALTKISKNFTLTCTDNLPPDLHEEKELCGAGKCAVSINPYGDVMPCNALQIVCGNIRKQSIKEIWETSEELQKVRNYKMKDIKGCENCDKLDFCSFCPGMAMTETGDPLLKHADVCLVAEARKALAAK